MMLTLPMAWLTALAMGASPALDALERARVCWAALDVECADKALADARAAPEALTPSERLDLWRLTAEVALTGDRRPEALDALQHALALDPHFAPAWSPAWNAVLADARRLAPDRLPPELTVHPPTLARPGKPLAFEVAAVDPSGVHAVTLFVQGPSGEVAIALQTADSEHWRGEIPKGLVRTPDLRLRVEATDRAGNPPATWPANGLAVVPVSAPEAGPPVTERWWFWTAIGAVVVGGAVALTLALTGDSGSASPSTDGRVPVILVLP